MDDAKQQQRLIKLSSNVARRVRESLQHLRPLDATSGESAVVRKNCAGTDYMLAISLQSDGLKLYLHSDGFSTPRDGLEMLPAFEQRAIDLFRAVLREDT